MSRLKRLIEAVLETDVGQAFANGFGRAMAGSWSEMTWGEIAILSAAFIVSLLIIYGLIEWAKGLMKELRQ
jgi:hypothetical protein